MGQLVFQTALDGLTLYLIMFLCGREPIAFNKKSILWYTILVSFCLLARISFLPISEGLIADIAFQNFELLPVNSLTGIIGLICVFFLLNSVAFNLNHLEVIFTTLLALIIWFVFRLLSIGFVDVLDLNSIYIRLFPFLLAALIYWRFSTKTKQILSDKSNPFTKFMIVNVFILFLILIVSANFEAIVLLENRISLFLLLFFISAFMSWLLLEQRKAEVLENRIHATEQFLPIIDELVLEVRARQHEFSNKLLAISSLVETTDDIEIAREKLRTYIETANLSNGQYELLNMDHKVIAGFLYTKMKRAEQLKIELQIARTVSVHDFPCEDADLIEVLGILIDNALEASASGDKIILSMMKVNGHLELTVSNPAAYKSNEQFMQLFDIGYSTKSTAAAKRGYGLYNVKEIAHRYGGRVIARNEQKGVHLITLGIQF